MKWWFWIIVFLFYSCQCNRSVFKQPAIEKYVLQECELQNNEEYEFCCVLISYDYFKLDGNLSMSVVFSHTPAVLSQYPDFFQSRYYHKYGKELTVNVQTALKEEVLNDWVEAFDYKHFTSQNEHGRLYRSLDVRLDRNTWQIIE